MNTRKIIMMRLFDVKSILFLSMFLLVTNKTNAQLNKFEAMYYQNQYLGNSAMAGLNKGLNVNMGYQRQLDETPGNPVQMYATAEYNPGSRMAYSFNFNSDRAGLITNTRVLGTFSYHLPIGAEDQKLNFGLSLGGRFLSLDRSKINGDLTDPSIQNFDEGGALDGDFGISYTTDLLTLQASVPNFNNVFFKNDNGERKYVDNQIYYTAVSYKIYVSSQINDFNIEPLVGFRGIKGYKDIVDIGAKFNLQEYNDMNISMLYHTNKVISGSFGISLDKLGVFLSYSSFVGNTGAYANDVFEFGLRYKFLD